MNRNFGQLIDGRLEYAPSVIIDGDKKIFTNDPVVMLHYGYKRIINTSYPSGGGAYRKTYTEDDETITIVWEEIPEDAD